MLVRSASLSSARVERLGIRSSCSFGLRGVLLSSVAKTSAVILRAILVLDRPPPGLPAPWYVRSHEDASSLDRDEGQAPRRFSRRRREALGNRRVHNPTPRPHG